MSRNCPCVVSARCRLFSDSIRINFQLKTLNFSWETHKHALVQIWSVFLSAFRNAVPPWRLAECRSHSERNAQVFSGVMYLRGSRLSPLVCGSMRAAAQSCAVAARRGLSYTNKTGSRRRCWHDAGEKLLDAPLKLSCSPVFLSFISFVFSFHFYLISSLQVWLSAFGDFR